MALDRGNTKVRLALLFSIIAGNYQKLKKSGLELEEEEEKGDKEDNDDNEDNNLK